MASPKGLVGGPMEGAVDSEVKSHVDFALDSHNAASNEEGKSLVEITKVTKQVVAGIKYSVELIAEGADSKARYHCQSVTLSQPWINPQPQIISFTATKIE